jgi:leucyl-tRNA synthetase
MNTAVSALMELCNHLTAIDAPPREAVETLVLCLAPLAPHLAEELWATLGRPPSIVQTSWPQYDPSLCEENQIELPVQVNGKVRGTVALAREADESAAKEAALTEANVAKFLEGKAIRKVIYVPGRILNLIVG